MVSEERTINFIKRSLKEKSQQMIAHEDDLEQDDMVELKSKIRSMVTHLTE